MASIVSKWIVVGAGPSLADTNLKQLQRYRKKWKVLAINCAWKLVPWADVLYAGDKDWWDFYGKEAEAFKGEKWTRNLASSIEYKLRLFKGIEHIGLCRVPGYIHLFGNSGAQGVNCVYHEQATHIILIGFDMHRENGVHFHGDHPKGMVNAPAIHMPIWRKNFECLTAGLKAEGVQLINATPGTALTCMPCMPLWKALKL